MLFLLFCLVLVLLLTLLLRQQATETNSLSQPEAIMIPIQISASCRYLPRDR